MKRKIIAVLMSGILCASIMVMPAAAEATNLLGDSDMDGTVTAKDASMVLMFAATMGLSDAETIGEELGMDITVSDVNADGAIDAKDAGNILKYTSAVGTGFVGTMEIFMMEPTAKNFEYYLALSDYEVYKEYCEVYGFEAEETLPAEEDLPNSGFLTYYLSSYPVKYGVYFYIWCDKDTAGSGNLEETPEVFGMPAEWYELEEIDSQTTKCHQVVDMSREGTLAATQSGTECVEYRIDYQFNAVSFFDPDYVEGSYTDSIVDIYRICLSLHHSDFVARFACQEDDPLTNPIVRFYTIDG